MKKERDNGPLDNNHLPGSILSSGLNIDHRNQQPQLSYVTIADNHGGNYML